MVVSCCALGCKERFTKGGAYTFHCFPKDEARRKLWEKQLRRGNFTSTPYSRICSKHFEEKYFQVEKFGGKWLKSDAVPTIFDFPPDPEEDEGEDIVEIPQDGEGNGEDQVKKKLRYIGDFDEKDMESPTKARKFLFVARTEQKMKKNKIRRLRRRNQALEDEVTTLKEILNRMNSNSASFYDVESISQAPLPASKKEDNPLEPTVVIKEEPIDYEPDPPDDECLDEKDEFILPHEENELTSRDSPLPSGTDPSQQPSFPVVCLETDAAADQPLPTTSILGETLRRKRKANPSKLSKCNQKVARSAAMDNNYVSYDVPQSPLDNADESSNTGSLNDSKVDHRHSSVDQYDVFGEYIAAKLRSLDRLSRVFAQKAIGDIIFEAEMGKYRGEDVANTPSPTPSSSHM